MANYYTRGQKHQFSHKNYDVIFNTGQRTWNKNIEPVLHEMLNQVTSVIFSKHFLEAIASQSGNRVISSEEINSDSITSSSIVEFEGDYLIHGKSFAIIIKKLLVRLKPRQDGEQVCCILDFARSATAPTLKTAYLNKAHDNHQKGLDTSDFCNQTTGIFGFETVNGNYKYYNVSRKGITAIK